MDKKQIRLIQESWLRVGPSAVATFYQKLFRMRPDLRPMFKGDLDAQRLKLHRMLGTVVKSLRNVNALIAAVEELGRRHGRYGVLPGHYEVVGAALIETLQEGLAEAWTPEVAAAWTTAYGFLSTTMIEAAAAERRATYRRPRRMSTNGGM
jgi:nitric oxide dioxygenase